MKRSDPVAVLGQTGVQDDADGLWLLFDNGRQKAAVNIGRPGPIVRRAILGWYRQAKGAIAAAEKSP